MYHLLRKWIGSALALCLFSVTSAAEISTDEIVKEVNAKKLVAILGEQEMCKQAAMNTLVGLAKQYPDVSAMVWSRVGYGLDLEVFDIEIAKHYAADFTADELKLLVTFFDPPAMRGLVFWVRTMAETPPAAEKMPEEVEKLRKKYGNEPVAKLGELFNSALGRQLLATQKSAAEIRRKEGIAALQAAYERVKSGR